MRQDFEAYARLKTFTQAIADTWETAFAEVIQQLGRPLEQVRFLDYGCGDGKYFNYLLSRGLLAEHVHGVEVSKLRVERCQALGWKQAVFLKKGQKLPYPDETMDVVNCMEVIEHIPTSDIHTVLGEIRRVLRPDGSLIVSTPNYPIKRFYDLYDAFIFRKWSRLRDDPTHVAFYNHARLSGLLRNFFGRLDERSYKTGFLYRRLPARCLKHKILYLCDRKNMVRKDF